MDPVPIGKPVLLIIAYYGYTLTIKTKMNFASKDKVPSEHPITHEPLTRIEEVITTVLYDRPIEGP